MKKEHLIFLDTETTGMGPQSRICQVAYKFQGQEKASLFKPPVPIEIDAMAICHITNRMVADKDPFIGSDLHQELAKILADEHILVAHNAAFDANMLNKENLQVAKMIDTCRVAFHLDEECVIPRYGLQYLRYYHDLEVENAVAHDALGDVRVLERIFEHYYEKMEQELKNETAVLEKMLELSAKPILIRQFKFGKYNGKKVAEVAKTDPGYLQWLLNEKRKANTQDSNDANWIYTLEHHLHEAGKAMLKSL